MLFLAERQIVLKTPLLKLNQKTPIPKMAALLIKSCWTSIMLVYINKLNCLIHGAHVEVVSLEAARW